MRIVTGALVALFVLGACGGAASAPAASAAPATPAATPAPAASVKIVDNPKLGKILANSAGFILYTYKPDTADTSNCSGGCATTWPPVVVTADAVAAVGMTGKLGTITRKDNGAKQVTYNSMPLYTYLQDKAAGDANGEGLGGNWFVIKNP
ncbi:MAG: hypothetical protein Q7S25_02055 [Candidatus Limnocylindria bacterium]|nr:hypothetical protein [Candidatus Limnocylindria bacterium]